RRLRGAGGQLRPLRRGAAGDPAQLQLGRRDEPASHVRGLREIRRRVARAPLARGRSHPSPPAQRPRQLRLDDVQRGLETLYRIRTDLDVRDFVIDAETRDAIGVPRAAREQLLVSEADGDLHLALFVDDRALANLAVHDPRRRLDGRNLGDFLLTVEGVSHFVYVAWRA